MEVEWACGTIWYSLSFLILQYEKRRFCSGQFSLRHTGGFSIWQEWCLCHIEMFFQLVCVDSLFQLFNCLRFLRRLQCPLDSAGSRIFLMGWQEVLVVQQLSIHQFPFNQTPVLYPLLAFLLATCPHSFSHCICLCGLVLYPSLSLLSFALLHFLLIVYLLIYFFLWPSHRLAVGRCICYLSILKIKTLTWFNLWSLVAVTYDCPEVDFLPQFS